MSKSILKATALIGGGQVINILIRLVRSKAIALILGPAGTGFIGALQSATALTQRFSSLGIDTSAVRDIAQAHALEDNDELQLVVSTQRMVVIGTGVLGMLLTIILAPYLSKFTFDTIIYTNEIRLVSLAVFFNLIQSGQTAIIQGTRQIRKLAELSIIGALIGTVVSIPFIYFLRLKGVAPYLVVAAFSQYLVTFYYARQLSIKSTLLSLNVFLQKTGSMVRLGLAFMFGGLATAGATYFIRAFLIQDFDLSGAGLYQAAFGISSLYINVVLQAMGKDFYPRLAAVAYQPKEEIVLINEQTEIGMILAVPGLLLTFALAPWAIRLLYSPEYIEAYSILQWMIFAVFLKTISWPMGYLYVARGKSQIFFITEFIFNLFHVLFVVILSNSFGLTGAGIAMLILYSFYVCMMYVLINRSIGFRWSTSLLKKMGTLIIIFVVAILLSNWVNNWIATSIIVCFAFVSGLFAVKIILKILDVEGVRDFWNKLRIRKK